MDDFGEKATEIRAQQKLELENMRRSGTVDIRGRHGVAYILMMCIDGIGGNIIPVGFGEQVLSDIRKGDEWKDYLIGRINEGNLL